MTSQSWQVLLLSATLCACGPLETIVEPDASTADVSPADAAGPDAAPVPDAAPDSSPSCPQTYETACVHPNGSVTCTNLVRDPVNCGACGVTCASQSCTNGVCAPGQPPLVCPAGQSACGTPATGQWCIPTASDANNCGGCGEVCPAGPFVCVDSHCECAAGFMMCPSGVPSGCVTSCS